jgi:hydroxyethylthiazole kinase-like uncharacterized protein yjeF
MSAEESMARDAAVIGSGVPSRALMQRAGAAAAAEIGHRYADRLHQGVVVFAGGGNNGGDGWVVAGALAAAGVAVRVSEVAPAKTDDALAERATALPLVSLGSASGREGVVVDAVLGTGASSKPRGAAADAVTSMNSLREQGAVVVAIDLPTGVDATTGAADAAVIADLTVTFGAMKRGLLVARDASGEIVVADIGWGARGDHGQLPELVDSRWVARRIPRISASAHKGTRRRIAIIGGGVGMVGAPILASRSAARSGAGMVRIHVTHENLAAVQTAAYEAMAQPWPLADDDVAMTTIGEWAHACLIGPGLGRSAATKELVERILRAYHGPVVLDADALNVFEGSADTLGALLAGRPSLITPHVTEFARLAGSHASAVDAARFDAGAALARQLNATVLLKGVPTVITSPSGDRLVSAAGNAALATAGSGDVLGGIAVTLLAQTEDPFASAACAAWLHGRAAEIAVTGRDVRGTTLDGIIAALPRAWELDLPRSRPPVLAELPRAT